MDEDNPSIEGESEQTIVSTDPSSIARVTQPEPDTDEDSVTAAFTPDQMPYVEKLRKENADRRVENKGWKDSFSAFDAQDQAWIQETFRLAGSDDAQVAAAGVARIEQMKNIITGVDNSEPAPAPAPATAPVKSNAVPEGAPVDNPEDAPITRAEFKRWQDEAAAEASRKTQWASIDSELAGMNIVNGTPEYKLAIEFARTETKGDLKEAADMVGRYQQSIVDNALSAKSGQSSKFPSTSGNTASGSAADPASQDAPSWENARAQLDSMIDAEPGEQS
jgi:hypothetical protein